MRNFVRIIPELLTCQ